MYASVILLHFFIVMLTLDILQADDSKTDNCTTVIRVRHGTKYQRNPGDSITVECPVEYCQEKPAMTWYKQVNQESQVLPSEQRQESRWLNGKMFVLVFSSVHKNDSGLYHCEASVGKQKYKGNLIHVIVQGQNNLSDFADATNTTEEHGASGKNKTWILPLQLTLGVLGLLTVGFIGLFFIRRHYVKSKISSASQSETNMLNKQTDTRYCNNSTTTYDPHVVSERHQDTPHLLQCPDGRMYDGLVNCWKSSRSTTNPAGDESVIFTHELLSETQDTLIYTTLNLESCYQISEPYVESEFIEYTTVGLKN